jgi:hypothetical protein
MVQESRQDSPHPQHAAAQYRAVTPRSIIIAFLILPINIFWVIDMEMVRYSSHPTTVSLMFNAIFILTVLTALNKVVIRRIRPQWALNPGELLLIYSVVTIASCIAGHDFVQILIPHLVWPYYESNSGNNYEGLFWDHLPKWVMMPDRAAATGFFEGSDTLYTRQHLLAWAGPVGVWTVFIATLLWVFQCTNVLIRKQWMEHEKLGFPLTRVPLEIVGNPSEPAATSIFKKRTFWVGFALAASIDITNSLNYYFPKVPSILTPGYGQSFFDLQTILVNKPWNAIGWTPVSYYPFVIGIAMLMPLDFLLSCWFFYIVWKAETVIPFAFAWDTDPRIPYANYQALGAYLFFFVSSLYLSRGYMKDVLRKAFGRPSPLDDSDEPISYRWALIGLAGGLSALVAFSMVLGLAWYWAVIFFAIYLALALAITRMRAELGTPVHDLHFTGPDWVLADVVGPQALGPQNLAVLSIFFWFNRAYRPHPMPALLEASKMADVSGAAKQNKAWFWTLLVAGTISATVAMWSMLHYCYAYGLTAKMAHQFGSEAWDRYGSWLTSPHHGGISVVIAILVGLAIASFLQRMRILYTWWPFHPLAFAVSGSWEMNLLWCPILIAYVTKVLILRYGGPTGYKGSLPFFYGLILGQFIPGSLLNIFGMITHTPIYQFWL